MPDNDDKEMMTADKLDQLIQDVAKKPLDENGDQAPDDEEEITLELDDES